MIHLLRNRRLVAVVLLVVLACGAGAAIALVSSGSDDEPPLPAAAGGPDRAREGRELLEASRRDPAGSGRPPARSNEPRYPASVRRQAARLSLPRQVAQLFAVGFDGYYPRAPFFGRFKRRGWGVVVLERRNFENESQLGQLAGEPAAVARASGLIAPIVAAPQVGGQKASAFPGVGPTDPVEVGESGSAKRAREEAAGTAGRLRELGLRMNLAPVADVATVPSPSADSAYSGDAAVASRLVGAAVLGYRSGGVIPAVAHFPGQGSASQDPQRGPATVGLSLDELRGRDLRPFLAAVAARVPVVVMSSALFAAYDGITPAVLLPEAHQLLRSIGFRGVVMTDDLLGTQAATGAGIGEVAVGALNAGADLLYLSGGAPEQEEAYRAILRAVSAGDISRERIRASLLKLLELKRRYKVG